METEAMAADSSPGSAAERRWFGLGVLALAVLLIAIDVSIMTTALPSIQRDLDISTATGQWLLTSYALPFGALMLLGGRISDYWGRKRTFMIGLFGFMVASALGGLAPDPATLLTARALQGACAALLVPASLSLVNVTFTESKERARALAVYNGVLLSGIAIGLALGGVLSEYLSWRWCLLVNPPVCVIGLVAAWPTLVESKVAGRPRYDLPGAVLGSASLAALVYGFARAGTDGWGDPVTIAMLVTAVVVGAVFLGVESRVEQPLLPLRLFADPVRSGALLATLLQFAALMGLWIFFALYLQGVEGHSPVRAGMMILPYALGAVVFAAVFEQPLGRMPRRIPIVAGLAGAALFGFWFGFLDQDWGYATHLAPAFAFFGMCIVAIMIAVAGAVLDDAPQDDSGVCSALLNVAQQVGMALGAALLTTIAVQVTENSADGGPPSPDDIVQGYNIGAFVAGGMSLLAVILTLIFFRTRQKPRVRPPREPASIRWASRALFLSGGAGGDDHRTRCRGRRCVRPRSVTTGRSGGRPT